MNYFSGAIAFLLDPANYDGTNPKAGNNTIPSAMVDHLFYTLLALVIAAVIAIPIGYAIGHTGRFRSVAIAVSGGARALPTFGVITLFGLLLGIGLSAPIISFVILAIPSVLAGAYTGFEAVDRRTIDAARAVGMTEWQIVTQVEIPLGLPLLIGGLRAATLQIVATATLAAYVGAGGLGTFILLGLQTQDYTQMVAGSILVILLAIVLEIVFSIVQRLVVPAGVAAGLATNDRARATRPRSVVGSPLQEGNK
ncbi:Glycine betaine/carnitine/choline transport system permease protein OpuCB [Frondihabitans sp. 762G35]|uniref:ABC transporter permease n=1 Tax=Frondihabitans sp. 762G35 TaxID=1446794 RepID=UPI000D2255BF|nr:ABC transporter permease [Frondihabitans sp. 762G35]ARC57127.1 Glycine betaine/carnitine/choline transport system permease protein OpuCB [Frondihabitans sp. 762G35]